MKIPRLKDKIISGLKDKIKKEINKERKIRGPLSKEQKHDIAKKVLKRETMKVGMMALVGALGIGTAIGGTKILNEKNESDKTNISEENTEISWKDGIVVDNLVENTTQNSIEDSTLYIINNIKNEEEALRFLKNLYIEEYEKIYGETDLTTEDLIMTCADQNYMYKDQRTGDLITHGPYPLQTVEVLKNNNVDYETKEGTWVYKIKTTEGEFLDCFTSGLQDVVPGEDYEAMKEKMKEENYDKLASLRNILIKGIDWVYYFNKEYKESFIDSLGNRDISDINYRLEENNETEKTNNDDDYTK